MNKKKEKKLLRQRKNVLVKNGVDIQKQVMSTGNGEFFTAHEKEYETSYVNAARANVSAGSAWKISFHDRKSGSMVHYRFSGQMQIGRKPSVQMGDICMILPGDAKVSKNHCMIYEAGGNLYLKDQRSKNHTYVNGRQVESPICIHSGDQIKIGDTILEIEFGRQGRRA